MIVLDDWQKEVLSYDKDLLLCTGRRVGKTYILARKACEEMVNKPNTPVIVVSLTEDQAQLIISMALNYLQDHYPKMIAKGQNKPTQKTITLTNKSKMISRPVGNTGDGARGFEGGILIVDEASRMPRSFWIAGKPVLLTTNGRIWMASTPFGKQGYFWERFDEAYNKKSPSARFKVFYISTEEVMKNRPISDSWTEEQREGALRILDEDRKEMSEIEYGQEYLGLFLDELRQFFPDELIDKCCILQRNPNMTGDKFLGVDIARMGDDESTFEVINKLDGKYYHVESQITKKTYTTQTEQKIIELDKMWNFVKIGIDAGSGSLGVGIYDHLLQSNIKRKIEAMNNRAIAQDRDGKKKVTLQKEDYYDNLRGMMERGEIKLLDDDNVKASLRSVQWEFTNTEEDVQEGKISKVRIFGKYTHVAEGIIRAAWLARKAKNLNFQIYYV